MWSAHYDDEIKIEVENFIKNGGEFKPEIMSNIKVNEEAANDDYFEGKKMNN